MIDTFMLYFISQLCDMKNIQEYLNLNWHNIWNISFLYLKGMHQG